MSRTRHESATSQAGIALEKVHPDHGYGPHQPFSISLKSVLDAGSKLRLLWLCLEHPPYAASFYAYETGRMATLEGVM